MAEAFFDTPDQRSLVKTKIVVNYFRAWSSIMLGQMRRPNDRMAYHDLFCGPGRYESGEPSTPLLILEHIVSDPRLASRVVTAFNDKDSSHIQKLQNEISGLAGEQSLKFSPEVTNHAVGRDVVNALQSVRLVPSLFFIDPFGYKGISIDLVGSAIRSWGCDCIFFFNYNRISPGIENSVVDPLIDELFGTERARRLRERVRGVSGDERRAIILSELAEGLREVGCTFVLPFGFQNDTSERTSHFIIFVSKHFLGYHIMKEVMAAVSSDDGGVKKLRVRSSEIEAAAASIFLLTSVER